MSVETNKQLITEAWDCISVDDIDGFFSRLTDDVTWTFTGSHRFAGTFTGRDELVSKLFTPLGEVLEGGIKIQVDTLTGEGDRVVMEAHGEAVSKSGLPYNNKYCLVITVADDKIAQVREYLDSELVTAVFGK